jgi:superfamily I DNA/RNA helicase
VLSGIPWEQLNAEQRQAVEAWDECLLVMAPVGTGKTSALAWRAANAIGHGVPARSVLCLSFTNKASRQMRERAAAVLGEDASKITARTFHSLCAMILRGRSRRRLPDLRRRGRALDSLRDRSAHGRDGGKARTAGLLPE